VGRPTPASRTDVLGTRCGLAPCRRLDRWARWSGRPGQRHAGRVHLRAAPPEGTIHLVTGESVAAVTWPPGIRIPGSQ
jgi:hypothetical protein